MSPDAAVYFPRVETSDPAQRGGSRLTAPAAAVREALNAGTLPLLPSASAPAALYAIRRLAARLPCCYLNLGNDRQQIPAAIATLLDGSS